MSIIGNMTKSYTTFGGVDITAMFDDMTVRSLQGIAVSITREKVPVYIMGKARPISVSRGKRGIAGTLQFVLFDRDALSNMMLDEDHFYYAHADEVNWLRDGLTDNLTYDANGAVNVVSEQWTNGSNIARTVQAVPEYMDQIYPFDVTLVAQNEYGNGAWSSLLGLEIINEGGGLSMDDLTNEQTATYIAIHRMPWTPMGTAEPNSTGTGRTTNYSAQPVNADMIVNSEGPVDTRTSGATPVVPNTP